MVRRGAWWAVKGLVRKVALEKEKKCQTRKYAKDTPT